MNIRSIIIKDYHYDYSEAILEFFGKAVYLMSLSKKFPKKKMQPGNCMELTILIHLCLAFFHT